MNHEQINYDSTNYIYIYIYIYIVYLTMVKLIILKYGSTTYEKNN
jgi:hypothetical protein